MTDNKGMMNVKAFKKIFASLMALLLSLLLCVPAFAAPEAVKIGYYDNVSGLLTDIQPPSGYLVEYCKMLEQVLGNPIQLVHVSKAQRYEKIDAGEVDALVGEISQDVVTPTKNPIAQSNVSIYVRLNKSDATLSDLRTVGVLENKTCQNALERFLINNPDKARFTTRVYKTASELEQALYNGDVDGAVQNGFCTMPFTIETETIGTQSIYFAVGKGNTALLTKLNTAMETLNTQQPNLQSQLMASAAAVATDISFTEEEMTFLKNAPTITVGVRNNFSPMSSYNHDSDFANGIDVEMIINMARTAGLSLRFTPYDGDDEGERLLESGEVDLLLGQTMAQMQELKDCANCTMPYLQIPIAFAVAPHKGVSNSVIGTWATLTGEEDYISDRYPDTETHLYYAIPDAFQALRDGEIFALAGNYYVLDYNKTLFNSGDVQITQPAEASYPVHIAVSKKMDSHLIPILDKIIRSMDAGVVNQIIVQSTLQAAPGRVLKLMSFIRQYYIYLIIIVVLWVVSVVLILTLVTHRKNRHFFDSMIETLDLMEDLIYVVNPDNMQVLFVNKKLKETDDICASEYKQCWGNLYGKKEMCEKCPMRELMGSTSYTSVSWDEEKNGVLYSCTGKMVPWVAGKFVYICRKTEKK